MKVSSDLRICFNCLRRAGVALPLLLFRLGTAILQAQTADVTLVWDPSTDTNVAGYNIYYGPSSGNYTNFINAGNTTNATVSGLVPGANYFFVATAISAEGLESDPSNEINYTPGVTNILNTPPTLSLIPDQTVGKNQSTLPIPFVIGDAESPATNLVLSARSSSTNLVPLSQIVFGGTAPALTVTITPAHGKIGTAMIGITLSDGSLQTETTFNLTVSGAGNSTVLGRTIVTNFQIVSITAEQSSGFAVGNATEVQWQSVAGVLYHILRKNDLGDAVWTDLSGDILADDVFTAWIDGTAAVGLPRYYRVFRVQ